MQKRRVKRKLPPGSIFMISLMMKSICKSLRLSISDSNGVFTCTWNKPTIYIGWHNRLLCLPYFLPITCRKNNFALTSQSRDGEYIADYLKSINFQIIRGSSSRGGMKALIQLKKQLENGSSVMIAVDGPRGPKYEVQQGAAWIACKTGAPIVPLSLNTKKHWKLKSWDSTQIPKPFTEAELVAGDHFYVESDNKSEFDSALKTIKERLMEITNLD